MAMRHEKDIETLKRFVLNSDRYCFCFAPNTLFGFLPNTSMNEKTHDLIKAILPYSKPFTVAVNKILCYLEELGLKCHDVEFETIKYEEFFHYPAIKELRFSVCKSIMKELMREFSMSLHHELICITSDKYLVKVNDNKEYVVFYRAD